MSAVDQPSMNLRLSGRMRLHKLARARRRQLAISGGLTDGSVGLSPDVDRVGTSDQEQDKSVNMDVTKDQVAVEQPVEMPTEDAAADGVEKRGLMAIEKPRRLVTLLPSVFQDRGPTLFFNYTVQCGAPQRPMERAIFTGPETPKMYYAHTDKVHEYNAVLNILKQGGLYRIKPDIPRWSLFWSNHPTAETLQAMRPSQRANHYPGSQNLARKDLIWRNISRMQRRFGDNYSITPQSFVLPKEKSAFDSARRRGPDDLWIWKPCSSSCGRGIKVLSSNPSPEDARQIERKRGVIQRYLPDPMLIDGYKFDLRVYVIVLSYEPLKVYINDEGLVRIATEKYSNSPESLASRTMHLTNYSLNKQSPSFVQNTDGRQTKDGTQAAGGLSAENSMDETRAFKWSFDELRTYFGTKGIDYDAMRAGIKDVVIKTLLAVSEPIREEWSRCVAVNDEGWSARGASGCHRSSCFEMYGFDILVDTSLKSWLLEVNVCPSLSSGSPLDKRIKTKLVADTLTLVGIRPTSAFWPQNASAAALSATHGVLDESHPSFGRTINSMSQEELDDRTARLLDCKTPLAAVALFDHADWDVVLDAHDEDMRCGGLERVYPSPECGQYLEFLDAEAYCDVVLRLWHEAGGEAMFTDGELSKALPSWLPRKICFSRT